ncbi:hypothetical protein [Apilactobacillus micheneri]|uniref:hypothetical protein n=1 Tax=Apilactobacillus micheneri TaxID=1899430 RepID=UPI0015E858AE|nr:hypothetical protein [Apilactobacillus micheneri]
MLDYKIFKEVIHILLSDFISMIMILTMFTLVLHELKHKTLKDFCKSLYDDLFN